MYGHRWKTVWISMVLLCGALSRPSEASQKSVDPTDLTTPQKIATELLKKAVEPDEISKSQDAPDEAQGRADWEYYRSKTPEERREIERAHQEMMNAIGGQLPIGPASGGPVLKQGGTPAPMPKHPTARQGTMLRHKEEAIKAWRSKKDDPGAADADGAIDSWIRDQGGWPPTTCPNDAPQESAPQSNEDLTQALDALTMQESSIAAQNSQGATSRAQDQFDFLDSASWNAATQVEKMEKVERDLNRTALQERLIAAEQMLAATRAVAAASGPSTSDDRDQGDDGKDEDPESDDHCADGVFQCPNGNPWPECTHAAKHDCPPLEHRDEAASDE